MKPRAVSPYYLTPASKAVLAQRAEQMRVYLQSHQIKRVMAALATVRGAAS